MSTEKTVSEIVEGYQTMIRVGQLPPASWLQQALEETLQAERTKRDEMVEAEKKRFGKILSEVEHSLKNANGSKSEITGIIRTSYEALTQPNNQN